MKTLAGSNFAELHEFLKEIQVRKHHCTIFSLNSIQTVNRFTRVLGHSSIQLMLMKFLTTTMWLRNRWVSSVCRIRSGIDINPFISFKISNKLNWKSWIVNTLASPTSSRTWRRSSTTVATTIIAIQHSVNVPKSSKLSSFKSLTASAIFSWKLKISLIIFEMPFLILLHARDDDLSKKLWIYNLVNFLFVHTIEL